LLGWDAPGLRHTGNDVVDLHEPEHAFTVGPS
jgi:hypothetical protein